MPFKVSKNYTPYFRLYLALQLVASNDSEEGVLLQVINHH